MGRRKKGSRLERVRTKGEGKDGPATDRREGRAWSESRTVGEVASDGAVASTSGDFSLACHCAVGCPGALLRRTPSGCWGVHLSGITARILRTLPDSWESTVQYAL